MIPLCGTFEYEAEFTRESFRDTDVVLHGSDLRGGEGGRRLAGHKPMIRFWRDRLVLVAADRDNSMERNVSFAIGDAVQLLASPGDRLYVVRTGAGFIGLSLLRQERLILATGAVTAVPLGRDILILKRPANSCDELIRHTWLDIRFGKEQLTLRQRETSEIGDYHIYVEHGWEPGTPGTDECVSVSVRDNPSMVIAAMRSAILLANGELKTTDWDCTEQFRAFKR